MATPKKTKVELTIEDIYKKLCPKCQEKLVELVAGSLVKGVVKKQLEKGGSTK